MPDSDDLISYCGLYCPGCDIHRSKTAHSIEEFQSALSLYKIDGLTKELGEEESVRVHFDRFEKILAEAKDDFGGCVGCLKGGGMQDCKVRSCSTDRGYRTCLDCIRMETCSELRNRSWALPALRKIRDEGYESWLKTKRELVEAGWSYLADSGF